MFMIYNCPVYLKKVKSAISFTDTQLGSIIKL